MPAALRTLSSSTATVAHAPTGTSWGGPAGVGSGVGAGVAVGAAVAVGSIDESAVADGVADGDAAPTRASFGRRSVVTMKPPITSSSNAPPKASPITRRRLGPDGSGGCERAGRRLAG